MEEIALNALECGGVVVAVANTLVTDNLEGDEVMALTRAVTLDRVGGKYATVGDEDRECTEVIEVMIDRRDTERAHRGDDHRAVEGADLLKCLRKPSVVIKPIKQLDCGAEEESGELRKDAGGIVEIGFLVYGVLGNLLEFFVDVIDIITGVKFDFYTGIRGFEGELLLYRHDALDVITGEDALSRAEAVDTGTLGHDLDVGGENDVEEGHIGVPFPMLFIEVTLDIGNINNVLKFVLGIVAGSHNERHDVAHRRERANTPSFPSVAPALLTGLIRRCVKRHDIFVVDFGHKNFILFNNF